MIPDFTRTPWRHPDTATITTPKPVFDAPEGIAIRSTYLATDRDGLPHVDGMPGSAPFLPAHLRG